MTLSPKEISELHWIRGCLEGLSEVTTDPKIADVLKNVMARIADIMEREKPPIVVNFKCVHGMEQNCPICSRYQPIVPVVIT